MLVARSNCAIYRVWPDLVVAVTMAVHALTSATISGGKPAPSFLVSATAH